MTLGFLFWRLIFWPDISSEYIFASTPCSAQIASPRTAAALISASHELSWCRQSIHYAPPSTAHWAASTRRWILIELRFRFICLIDKHFFSLPRFHYFKWLLHLIYTYILPRSCLMVSSWPHFDILQRAQRILRSLRLCCRSWNRPRRDSRFHRAEIPHAWPALLVSFRETRALLKKTASCFAGRHTTASDASNGQITSLYWRLLDRLSQPSFILAA